MYKNLVVGKRVLVDVSLQLLTVPGKERDWFVGGYYDGGENAVSEIDRYIEGWMDGRCSFVQEGRQFLGSEIVDAVSKEWSERWVV
jgi:hypothetical protein